EIGDHEVGPPGLEHLDPGYASRGGDRLVPELLDRVRETVADGLVVIDDQDRGHSLTIHRTPAAVARPHKPAAERNNAPEPHVPRVSWHTTAGRKISEIIRDPLAVHAAANGRTSVNVVSPSALFSSIRPPWSAAISRTNASPSPVPRSRVV